MAAVVYCHGGGGIMFNPDIDKAWLCRLAATNLCIFFSIDYRLGPETKCPGGHQDCVAAVKYFSSNAAKFGIK